MAMLNYQRVGLKIHQNPMNPIVPFDWTVGLSDFIGSRSPTRWCPSSGTRSWSIVRLG